MEKIFNKKLPFYDYKFELDYPEFDKKFDLYCSDKMLATQLLNDELVQLLLNFQEEMQINCYFTLKDNYIYIRFMCGNMFEPPSVYKSSLDKETLFKYYSIVESSLTLTSKICDLLQR